eukprot:1476718-Rhodomonas_salina.2
MAPYPSKYPSAPIPLIPYLHTLAQYFSSHTSMPQLSTSSSRRTIPYLSTAQFRTTILYISVAASHSMRVPPYAIAVPDIA